MGTRADYYVGRGPEAEWLGSVTWDGNETDPAVLVATNEQHYREAVAAFLASREDATLPTEPWPWPWDDSRTTDCAYAFDGGRVWLSTFGHGWYLPGAPENDDGEPEGWTEDKVTFPDMSARRGDLKHIMSRSGLITFRD